MDLKKLSYWAVHLRNGATIYCKEQPEWTEGMLSVEGLDGQRYYFPHDQVAMFHYSTPETRAFYVELMVSTQEELQEKKAEFVAKLMEKQKQTAQDHGVVADHVGYAMEALRRPGSRAVHDE
jgi:hypothetical protein